ncbi:bifunctional 4-hydroxy-2-oxoglutarate aldolase/2-dehydro-3-deoxy-phosphogluconate aldolase [Vibrio vulnificus]|jgi:2-dehydro-3-deoxyphosphogluconate aldolase/(4S)-4-hydroxy-2-oxoglutarate aldolase|uniref:bifunctional 4-hydroxy-2-oxoglutarate aldolase/2-dehydro-3-deoxy-phosphogluconate aldolase n=1 Tax=Vibrio vulnificus TaxID=672 RepID=UPI000A39CF91|nr:bifunctional 4-hydroxy-2-oxoglutarate aldolase/2-dehydro-3-deoxy-phosphogluconate aldolase [Vibrio vulnificus]EGQ7694771.1 bifunctional 4-hydroxy-2-oxoglutarate aldolase/2-dehydro-3-deoxy-phosphogluconate aldolase [Vibrio vulnificus]EGQ7852534.1 bifunctional 4-hydroxy-2-oxoglutarate aldolase/2-dehydro-3-deoxy-phosphogluconate aldolase [Vibrio vulnificus]EGQ8026496.1 bifunctional 4-hydroxy-2-oxoglutarate aldolase/2-dehydro-3-deoxy-phosphogluconate aldolase [Vibrio vulnificus]EHD0101620.1 bifu
MSSIKEQLKTLKVIPVIAIDKAEDIIPLGKVLAENGLPAAEITFRSAAAAEAIRLLRETQPDMLIGAGTVLNREQAIAAKEAGATFIVSPGFNPNTVKACQEIGIDIVPGVNNPSTVEAALEMGLTTLKFFPAEASGGINMVKSLLAPYTDIELMPTGGINPANIKDYLAIPRVLACGGTWMVDKKLIEAGNWEELARLTREAVALVNE